MKGRGIMSERKLEITDKTLVVLDLIYKEKIRKKIPKLRELIKLIYEIGSDYIEITEDLYKELYPLPKGVRFKLNNNLMIIKGDFYMCENISKELLDINNNENIRIVGLDDIIFYDYEKIFFNIKKTFGDNIDMCIKNEYKAATAMNLEWIKLGGNKVVTTFAGIGGYAPLEEILGSLSFLEKIKIRGDQKLFPKVLNLFEDITEIKLRTDMPFIGKDIFNVESGIHVNGIAKNPSTYEPYDPNEIGRKRNIIIGKHSGINALEIKLSELNIKYNSDNLKLMLEDVRKLSTENRRGLNNEEIEEVYKKCCI